MARELRKTAISVVGDVPWGTHFCYFYDTKQDLLDTLIPYFKAGLESKEFCIWVISNSELITVEEAKKALGQAVPDLDRYLAEGSIEVVSHDQWFLKGGAFDRHRVANALKEKLNETLAKGYAGMRINGSPAWLHDVGQKELRKFEEEPDKLFAKERIITSCTYPLAAIGGDEVFDVVRTHRFAIARRQGKWEVIETPQLIQAKDEVKILNEELEQRVLERTSELRAANEELRKEITDRKQIERQLRESQQQYESLVHSTDGIVWEVDAATFRFIFVSKQAERILGYASAQWLEPSFWVDHLHPDDRDWAVGFCVDATQRRVDHQFEYRMIAADGRVVWLRDHTTVNVRMDQSVRLHGVMFDITERKQAEERLKQGESQLVEAQRLAHVGSWNWDIEGNTLTWSEELYRIFGLNSDVSKPTYETYLKSVHPEDREFVKGAIEESLRTTEPFSHSLRIIRHDGEIRVLDSQGQVVSDERGNPSRMFGTCQDVTEQKRAEEALRKAEQKYRDIFENAAEGIFQTTPDGRFIAANPALARMLGFDSPEELISKRTDIAQEHYVDPESREEFKRSLAENGFALDFELEAYRRDGSKIWISENVRAVRDEQGSVLYYEGTSQDVTDRKRAEESLKLFRTLIDRSTDAIEVIDPDTLRFLDCNKSAYHDLGYTREEFLSLSVYDVDPRVDERMTAQLAREMDRSGFVMFESIHRRKDGSTFPVEVNLKTVRLERDYRLAVVRDITERKAAEEALRQAEQKYRRIFENASEGIFQSTPEGKLIAANPALAVMYGFDSQEEMIRTCNDIYEQMYVDPGRREEFRNLIEQQGVVRDFECQAFQKDGNKLWISLNARAVRNEQGAISYYEGTAQDITDRKHAEDELIKQKEILQKIVDHLPVMINFTDSANRIKFVNREWQETLGWTLEEMENENLDVFAECYPAPEDRQKVLDFIKDATEDWVDFKTRIRDGRLIDTSWARVKLSDGTTIGIGQDITARKRAEQALRQAEQKYRELFENAKDATYVHDLRGRYMSVNRAAEQLSGYSREEILGKDFGGFVGPEYQAHMRENLYRKLRHEGETTYEVEVITKDGIRIPVEVSSRLIYEEGVPVAVQGTARNIAERKRAEEALRDYSRQLIRAQEAERQSIARELHDQIGQVLTAIRINLETIRDSSSRAESNALIDEGVTIVDEAIQQVRDLSFELRPSLLDDLGLTAALRWYADRYAQRAGIRVTTTIKLAEPPSRLPRELETACFRIVQEALTNVARHARAKNVLIDLGTSKDAISLSIKDDGIGFDQHSWDPNSSHLLGLRGMQERALALGGKLEIHSALSKGTEIRAHFPNGSIEVNS